MRPSPQRPNPAVRAEPRGIGTRADGEREGVNTMRYRESEIRRIAHVATTDAPAAVATDFSFAISCPPWPTER